MAEKARAKELFWLGAVVPWCGAAYQCNEEVSMHKGCADGSYPCQDILGGDEGHRCCIPRFGRKPSTCRALFSGSFAGRSFNRDVVLEGYYVRITCIIVKQCFDEI